MPIASLKGGIAGYRELLSPLEVRRLVLWGLLARIPFGMGALALVLLIRGVGGSYADAGIAVAANALAAALGAPVGGRLIDRHRPSRVLRAYGVVYPATLALLLLLAWGDAPMWALAAAAAASGLCFPPVGPTVRTMWTSLVDSDSQRTSAFALEATLQELIFVTGPLIVGALTALISSSAGIAASAVMACVGVLGFASTPAVREHRTGGRGERRRRNPLAALAPAGVRRIIAFSAGYGLAFGAIEVALPAFAEDHGGRSLGAVALAAWSAGSLAGGLLAASHSPVDPHLRLRTISLFFTAALVLPLLADSMLVMSLMMFVAGLPIAPSFAITYGLIEQTARSGTQAEVFGWTSTAIISGVAAGTAAGGNLITHVGIDAALALGVCGAALAAAVASVPRSQRVLQGG